MDASETDSDDHGATIPASARAETQECAVSMLAVQAQLQLDTGAYFIIYSQLEAQIALDERVGDDALVESPSTGQHHGRTVVRVAFIPGLVFARDGLA
jgi:hypothetical protein